MTPAEAIRRARGIVVLTGAGVSAESNVPTFRDPGGLWDSFDPTELATPGAFRRDPARVWGWYAYRRRTVRRCLPNPGHRSLARLLADRDDVLLVTQNVDGLHQRALEAEDRGAAAGDRILELHGSLLRVRCSGCAVAATEYVDPEEEDADLPLPPPCPGCGDFLRPDVVWFGELLDGPTLDRAFEAARRAELCLIAGTSALVHPAASIPLATLEGGGHLLEVNPEPTPLTPLARWSLRRKSGEALPELLGG